MTGIRFFLAAVVAIAGQQAFAQLPQTRITSVFPPGGQQGTTVDLTVGGGTDLDEVDQLVIAHPGITAVQKMDTNGSPVANTFSVTVAADVPAGLYDVRVRGLYGISNPRLFRIDSLPEAAEVEPNDTLAQATPVTMETIINAQHARSWLEAGVGRNIAPHLVAVTNNTEAAGTFGIPDTQILRMPEWVGGRFSLWSGVGLSIMLACGSETFDALLAGAGEMDAHFLAAPLERNAPVILALLSAWYVNFWGAQVHAVLPYSKRLNLLPDYLQQLEMESNGKRIDRAGKLVAYATAPVIFGNVGANSQHSFHQLFHQGTHLVPSDFVVMAPTPDPRSRMLAINALAQTAALMNGDASDPAAYPGNQPSTTIVLPSLSGRTLGALLSLYEHKVFVEGVLWNINSFDQPGVELGKRMATTLLPAATLGDVPHGTDSSTRSLIERINRN